MLKGADVSRLRKDFPLLSEENVIYFDNACVSLRPQQVVDEINNYYRLYSACAGRSSHRLADLVNGKYWQARKAVANFIGAKKPEEIIFTRNTSEAINLVAKSFNFHRGDIVLTTDKEHNSNLLPWLQLRQGGVLHEFIPSRPDNTFDLDLFKKAMQKLKGKVKMVAMVLASNLDGVSIPAKEIIKIAHSLGAVVLLDGAQAVGHKPIDVSDLDCDFLAFSGHKMCGPSGTGVLYGKYSLLEKLSPFLLGGDTVSDSTYDSFKILPPPEKFEAGLQNYAGAFGLATACQYLDGIGLAKIEDHLIRLNKYVSDTLLASGRVEVIGPRDASLRGGIFSFNIKGVNFHEAALMLGNMADIAVRSGRHCVHSWFNSHQVEGSVRASFYFYNTLEECRVFVKIVQQITALV